MEHDSYGGWDLFCAGKLPKSSCTSSLKIVKASETPVADNGIGHNEPCR